MNKLVALFLAALVLVACGNAAEEIAERAIEAGADGDVDVEFDLDDEGQGEFVIETEDGTQTVDLGATELPDGLQTPLLDGYDVISSTVFEQSEGSAISVLVHYPRGTLDDVVAHFDDHFEGQEGISRTANQLEGAQQVFWIAPDANQSVTVVERDGDDFVEVAITELTEN